MLSWLFQHRRSHAVADIRRDHSLFELSVDHVCEYLESLMRVEAEAIVSLDPILVDNSQTSKRFKAVRQVFSENRSRFSTPSLESRDTHGGTANV
jgi:hypothetical protein